MLGMTVRSQEGPQGHARRGGVLRGETTPAVQSARMQLRLCLQARPLAGAQPWQRPHAGGGGPWYHTPTWGVGMHTRLHFGWPVGRPLCLLWNGGAEVRGTVIPGWRRLGMAGWKWGLLPVSRLLSQHTLGGPKSARSHKRVHVLSCQEGVLPKAKQ